MIGIGIGTFHFSSLSLFRHVHATHHAYLGTERDEQLWPFVDTRMPRWFRRTAAFGELTLGMFYDAVMFWNAFLRPSSPVYSGKARHRVRLEFAIMVVVWGTIFTLAATVGTGKWLFWLFILPALTTGSLYAFRKYIEHMGLLGRTPAGLSRSIIHTGPLGKLFNFTMFNIGYHGVHHAYSSMPQHSLPEFAGVLENSETETEVVYPSYRKALGDMLPTLADPRIGSQWLTAVATQPAATNKMTASRSPTAVQPGPIAGVAGS
ncbi:MAG: fatty acid desaturase [Pirellulales bacterium]